MPDIPRVGDMEVGQDLAFQRREWAFERAGWMVMAFIVVAALLGLLGRGPLSSTSAADPEGLLRIEYNRFLHYHDPTTLHVHVDAGAARRGELRLWMDRDYLAGVEISRVSPEPERVEAGPDRHTFVFRVAEAAGRVTVVFHLEADEVGPLPGRVGVGDREPARFRQFVYP